MKKLIIATCAIALAVMSAVGLQSRLTPPVEAQSESYPPLFSGVESIGAYPRPQSPDPVLFFEAKAHWPSLNIATPRTAWEFVQRGMYKQDDLEDVEGALADYRDAERLNDHLLLIHARIGTIYLERGWDRVRTNDMAGRADLDEAIHRFEEVLAEQPYRQGMNFKLGWAYLGRFRLGAEAVDLAGVERYFAAELTLNKNHQRTLYERALLMQGLGRTAEARSDVQRYLAQVELHSDPYPYRVLRARKLLSEL